MPIDLSPFAIRQVHVDLPSDNLRVDTVVARKLFKGAKIQKCDRIGLYLLPPLPFGKLIIFKKFMA